jgi:hypothetical protein
MIGTVISVVAVGVSLFVLVDSRRLDRRDLLLKLREQLIAPDRQTGRQCSSVGRPAGGVMER